MASEQPGSAPKTGDDATERVLNMLGQIMSRMDSHEERVEALEKSKEPAPAKTEVDKAKADADDKDAKEKEAEAAELKAEAKREEAKADADDYDEEKMAEAQAKADSVYVALGKRSAPIPRNGEGVLAYRRRVAKELAQHSDTWKENAGALAKADSSIFAVAEAQIYADAQAVSSKPIAVPKGQLRQITKMQGPHQVTTFEGDPGAWMNTFALPIRQASIVSPSTFAR